MRLAISLSLLPLALLAGCGGNEEAMLKELRAEALSRCNNSAQAKQAAPGFDAARFCTCVTDKTFQGRSLAQLAKLGEDGSDAEAQRIGMEAGSQCLAEQTGGAAPAATATPTAPAATPALPDPQAAQNTGAETVEETADDAD